MTLFLNRKRPVSAALCPACPLNAAAHVASYSFNCHVVPCAPPAVVCCLQSLPFTSWRSSPRLCPSSCT